MGRGPRVASAASSHGRRGLFGGLLAIGAERRTGEVAVNWGLLAAFNAPRPESRPHSYIGWPLRFVGAAFIHTWRAGGLLVLGLLLSAFLPVHLPWG